MEQENIYAPMTDNETWNQCPECGAIWKSIRPTPGLLHRIRICLFCLKRVRTDKKELQ